MAELETENLGGDIVTMTSERIGMAPRISALRPGGKVVGHDRPKAGVVGVVAHLDELFLGDREVVAQATQPR